MPEDPRAGLVERLLAGVHWLGPIVVGFAVVGSIVISALFGFFVRQPALPVDTQTFVVVAGLFVGALAIERMTELLIAPWVGQVEGKVNREALIGSAAIVFGVAVAGSVGLYFLDIVTTGTIHEGASLRDNLLRSVDIFVTGLAIGGGTKPLHDLLSRLERSVEQRKDRDLPTGAVVPEDLAEQPSTITLKVETPQEQGRRMVRDGTKRPSESQQLRATLLTVWPAAVVPDFGSSLPRHTRVEVPSRYTVGSDSYVREAFALAYRGESAGLRTVPVLSPLSLLHDSADAGGVAGDPAIINAADARWAHKRMGLTPELIVDSKGGEDVRVAHMDTGYRKHRLGPNWLPELGRDFLDPNATEPLDPWADDRSSADTAFDVDLVRTSGHGTATGSVIGGVGSANRFEDLATWWPDVEVIGVAPKCEIVPFRVMRGPVHLFDDDVAKAVEAARKQHCHIISMALGGYAFVGLREQIQAAVDEGIIVAAAAGNHANVVGDPAAYPEVIAVANTTAAALPNLHESSSGPTVAVSAPGTLVWRAAFGDDQKEITAQGTGTSFSVSLVAGLAALWLSHHDRDRLIAAYGAPNVPRLFAHLLRTTAQAWPDDLVEMGWGAGIPDAEKLLAARVLNDDGTPSIDPTVFEGVLTGDDPSSPLNRLTAMLASVFTGNATLTVREKIVRWLGRLVAKVERVPDPFQEISDQHDRNAPRLDATHIPYLITRELQYGLARDPNFTVPEVAERKASEPLREVLAQTGQYRTSSPRWAGELSAPLRRALAGHRPVRVKFRWVGMLALLLAVALGVWLGWSNDDIPAKLLASLGVLGLGITTAAQSIERFLEIAVAPYVFRGQRERAAERALILLGIGILLGTGLSLLSGVFILESLALGTLDGARASAATQAGNPTLLRILDVLITGLVIGGGTKPIHDLIERIKIAKNLATPRHAATPTQTI